MSGVSKEKSLTAKEERQAVFQKYSGKCAYCGCDLLKGWHADHLKPVGRELEFCKTKKIFVYSGKMTFPQNDVLENKMPACASCNINKHSLSLEEFRKSIQKFVNSLNQYSTQYKIAKRYGLIQETERKVKFYFEELSEPTIVKETTHNG